MSTHARELSSAQSGQLIQKLSYAISCRRAQICSKRLSHAGAQLFQLMQESSALSAHAEELSHISSSMTLPSKKTITWAVEVQFW